jgi:hypothetical protein
MPDNQEEEDMQQIDQYDVIVIGGGPGGVGAAVAAGTAGAKVLLVEREGCLGGAGTTMLVNPFMPMLTFPGPNNQPPRKVVHAGTFQRAYQRLKARSAGEMEPWNKGWGGIHFDDEPYKRVLDELVCEAGVEVLFHTALFDVEREGTRVRAAHFAHNSGPLRISGKVFIDATGDGLLAARAGAEFQFGDEQGRVMPMTLFFAVSGVDRSNVPWHDMQKLCAAGGQDTPALINTNLSCVHPMDPARSGLTDLKSSLVYFNAIRIAGNTLDPFDVSRAEIEGRRRVENFVQWLKAKVPGFKDCQLVKTGAHIGIRESRRVMGDYVLTSADFDRAAKFDDGIACGAYPVDIHGDKPNQFRLEYLPLGEYYQIPYRCLTAKGLTNLLVASRSISCDVRMHASLRTMPSVMCIGDAAGFAAALSLPQGDVRQIDVSTLRQKIRDYGGIIDPPLYQEPS